MQAALSSVNCAFELEAELFEKLHRPLQVFDSQIDKYLPGMLVCHFLSRVCRVSRHKSCRSEHAISNGFSMGGMQSQASMTVSSEMPARMPAWPPGKAAWKGCSTQFW